MTVRTNPLSRCKDVRELSSVRQFETFLHPFQSVGHPINALGKLRNLHVNLRKFNMNVGDLTLD